MPVPIERRSLDLLHPPQAVEKLLGTQESDRRPKTLIPGSELALALGVMENHSDRTQELLDRLNGGKPYAGAITPRSWRSLHGAFLNHLGSVDGFTMRVAVGMLRNRVETLQSREASIGGNGTVQVVEHD